MIQEYLKRATDEISARYSDDVQSLANWEAKRPHYVEQYAYMLGLSPRPEKTPLLVIGPPWPTADVPGTVLQIRRFRRFEPVEARAQEPP